MGHSHSDCQPLAKAEIASFVEEIGPRAAVKQPHFGPSCYAAVRMLATEPGDGIYLGIILARPVIEPCVPRLRPDLTSEGTPLLGCDTTRAEAAEAELREYVFEKLGDRRRLVCESNFVRKLKNRDIPLHASGPLTPS